jgi:hypothetical protein
MDVFDQQRTWERAVRLSLAQLVCLGRHSISNLLCACGRQFQDWSADYRLFSSDRWDAQRLFRPVLAGVLAMSPPDSHVVVAMDDTHLRKSGKHTPGVAYRRDPLSPPFHCNLIPAQRFLQASVVLRCQDGPGPGRALPVRFLHAPPVRKPKKSDTPQAWQAYREQCRQDNLSTRGAAVIGELRQELDQEHDARCRRLVVCVDGSYTNRTVLRRLPERTTLIGRIRKDAKFFQRPAPRQPSSPGAPAKYGPRLPTPDQLRTDESVPWQEVRAFAVGEVRTFRVKTLAPALWEKAGADRPLRVVVIAPTPYRHGKGGKLLYRQPAFLICTDLDMPLEQIVQEYLWRWDIEVNHRDEKQIIGVGQAQVWSPQAVDRQPAFAVASYSMLLLSAARAFGASAVQTTQPPPKWRGHGPKQRITTQELVQELRNELWSQALEQPEGDSGHFVIDPTSQAKCPEPPLTLPAAVRLAATG